MSIESPEPNALIEETSPYLQQHAYNPIRWNAWRPEVLERAKREDKMIFLSIGYSTCHWCHVMEEETFEDAGVAKLLEEDFVCIKVDREERPDIDAIYMNFIQTFAGQGGWPLNVWLTPDLKPIYGGTYFPKEDSQGRAGFTTLVEELSKGWTNIREKLISQADDYTAHLKQMASPMPSSGFSEAFLLGAFDGIKGSYDVVSGGFSTAPKFPQPSFLRLLLGLSQHEGIEQTYRDEARVMVCHTLDQMAQSGIHDQLEGGFHRYAVDEDWKVPHFEKMLYDQALVSRVYLQAAQVFGEPRYLEVGLKVLDYVSEKLSHEEGGFLSAWDADSTDNDGVKREGAYYLFTWQELKAALSQGELSFLSEKFGFAPQGNIEPDMDPHHEMTGKNILHANQAVTMEGSLAQKLLSLRSQKPLPHLDDKVITSWNGLMISSYLQAYAQTSKESFFEKAKEACSFIHEYLVSSDGELMRSYREGVATAHAVATDYANWIAALLDLFEVSGDLSYFEHALQFQKQFDQGFLEANGGYRNQSRGKDSDQLMPLQDHYDGAEPSANAIASQNLLRFYSFTQNKMYLEQAETLLQAFGSALERSPLGTTEMQLGILRFFRLKSYLIPPRISGRQEVKKEWLKKQFGHASIVSNLEPLSDSSPFYAEAQQADQQDKVLYCSGRSCQLV